MVQKAFSCLLARPNKPHVKNLKADMLCTRRWKFLYLDGLFLRPDQCCRLVQWSCGIRGLGQGSSKTFYHSKQVSDAYHFCWSDQDLHGFFSGWIRHCALCRDNCTEANFSNRKGGVQLGSVCCQLFCNAFLAVTPEVLVTPS